MIGKKKKVMFNLIELQIQFLQQHPRPTPTPKK